MKKQVLPTVNSYDMTLSRDIFGSYFSSPSALPVSYTYNGKQYKGLPENSCVTRRFVDANIVETVFTGKIDDVLNVRAECYTYRDYPAVEWTVYFDNVGTGNSKMLKDVKGIDVVFPKANATLVHNNGDFYSEEGYTVSHTVLKPGATFTQAPVGGRPCDRAFPYQRLLFDNWGLNISIGWPGQWSCEYQGKADGIAFVAGQQTINTYLKPGETLRTPRMTLLAYDGTEARGINVWRRFFNAHVTPRQYEEGALVGPKAVVYENAFGIEFTKANEENQIKAIKFIQENIPEINTWWIDAGWYPCLNEKGEPEWPITGSWYPDPARFPNGLAPVGKACRDAGMDLLVWFEPERMKKDTQIVKDHPDWALPSKEDLNNFLLDLTNPECFNWLCQTISELIKESDIKCYRQDFNFCPLPYWNENTGPNREGMLENQYLQAYLAYWDYLLMNNPGLWIDSCSSGGRRNDLETMRRSVPLHPTDYGYGYHHVNQAFRHTLCSWIPYTRSFTQSWDKDNEYYPHEDYYAIDPMSFDNYKLVNGFGVLTVLCNTHDIEAMPEAIPYVRKMLGIWERFSMLMLHGDFYALTENHRDFTKWTVFQFDSPEAKEGAIQAMRNNQSKEDSLTVKLHALKSCCTYRFENEETGESFTVSGNEACEKGITLSQPVRSGSVWFYKVI